MDYSALFPSFPDTAQIWIFASETGLNLEQQEVLLHKLDRFFLEWVSHSDAVGGQAVLLDERFLVVAGSVPGRILSGCGIDQMTDAVHEVARAMKITWASPLTVFYTNRAGAVVATSRPEFKKLVETGGVDQETSVYDVSVNTVGAIRCGAFRKPAGETWTRRYFASTYTRVSQE